MVGSGPPRARIRRRPRTGWLRRRGTSVAPVADLNGWIERDVATVWHGFTQMEAYAGNRPVIVERGEGRELIDVEGNRYLDAISSLWVTTLGHAVPELDEAVRQQLG